jgi:hypothetical protein
MQVDLKRYISRVNQKLATGKTVFQVFSECYEDLFKKPCVSDTVSKDAVQWVLAVRMGHGPIVPKYVSRHFENEDARREYLIGRTMMFGVAEGSDPFRRRG